MAIYTRFGEEVQFLEARMVPMWSERRPGEYRHHYAEPKPTKRTQKIEEMPTWHVRAKATAGRSICDGKWVAASNYVADDGIREIHDAIHALVPDWETTYRAWNKIGAPSQVEFWPVIDRKLVA